EVYALTLPPGAPAQPLSDAQITKFGTRIDAVDVKAPRDPDLTTDPDDPSDEVEAPAGRRPGPGPVGRGRETRGGDATAGLTAPPAPKRKDAGTPVQGPLVGPGAEPPSRTYAVVGISTRGKKGPVSKRVVVPLGPPPPPPSAPRITYTEREISVTWPTAASTEA